MTELIIRNYEQTKEEILVGYDKGSFMKTGNKMKRGRLALPLPAIR